MIAEENIYKDGEGNIVSGDDPRAAFLVAGKGTEIPKDIIEKYGLDKRRKKETEGDEEGTVDQKKTEPAANKALHPAKNKGAK